MVKRKGFRLHIYEVVVYLVVKPRSIQQKLSTSSHITVGDSCQKQKTHAGFFWLHNFNAIGPFFTDLSFAFVPFHTTKTQEAEKTSDTDQVWSSFSYPSALYLFGGAYEFGPPRAKNTSLAPVCRE